MRIPALVSTGGLCCLLMQAHAWAGSIDEVEPNHWAEDAQAISKADFSGGEVRISGILGELGLGDNPDYDADLFSFDVKVDETYTVAIENGIGGVEPIHAHIAVLGPAPEFRKVRWADYSKSKDPVIEDFTPPETGTYTVGVSVTALPFAETGGKFGTSNWDDRENGDYTLVITQVRNSHIDVPIDIQPGNERDAWVNPKGRGLVRVAVLSQSDFNAKDADQDSLTFGASGDEDSLKNCEPRLKDVSGDGRDDLVCHFDLSKAGFSADAKEGVLKGKLSDGSEIKGTSMLGPPPNARR